MCHLAVCWWAPCPLPSNVDLHYHVYNSNVKNINLYVNVSKILHFAQGAGLLTGWAQGCTKHWLWTKCMGCSVPALPNYIVVFRLLSTLCTEVAVSYSTVVFNIFLNIIQNIKTMFETVPVLSASEGGFYAVFVCALFIGATH